MPSIEEMAANLRKESPEFNLLWGQHDVAGAPEEIKQIMHPEVGLLILRPTSFRFTENEELTLKVFTPEPGTESEEKLKRLFTR